MPAELLFFSQKKQYAQLAIVARKTATDTLFVGDEKIIPHKDYCWSLGRQQQSVERLLTRWTKTHEAISTENRTLWMFEYVMITELCNQAGGYKCSVWYQECFSEEILWNHQRHKKVQSNNITALSLDSYVLRWSMDLPRLHGLWPQNAT